MFNHSYVATMSFAICRKSRNDIAKFLFNDVSIEYKIWDESSSVITVINSIEAIYPQCEKTILLMQKVRTFLFIVSLSLTHPQISSS